MADNGIRQKLMTLMIVHEIDKQSGEREPHKIGVFILWRLSTGDADHSTNVL